MYWYGNGMSGWGYGLMTLSMILFWGLVIYGIVLLVRYLGRDGARAGRPAEPPRPPEPRPAEPERLLAERFARGEIDQEEYQQRLAVLHGSQPSGPPREPAR